MDYIAIGTLFTFVILLVAHFGISRRNIPPEQTRAGSLHWSYLVSLVLSFLLLCGYFGVLGYLFYEDTVWPHVGSLSIIFFLVMCPGIMFQLYFLGYSLMKRKLPVKRVWARLLSIVLGLILGSQIPLYAQKIAMDHFVENHQPLVGLIQKNLPDPCNPQIPYKDQESLDETRNMEQLWHDETQFVLAYHGGSADIDGSTIFYASKEGTFGIFHNDNHEESSRFNGLIAGMTPCQEK